MFRVPAAVAAALVALVVAASPAFGAQASPLIEAAAEELRGDPVFVHPDAEFAITDDEADELRKQIADSGEPIFIAVLPEEAGLDVGGPNAVPRALGEAIGLSGTYAAVTGNAFRATSTVVPQAGAIATSAFQARQGEGVAAVLGEFVRRIDDAPTGNGGVGTIGGDEVEDTTSLLPWVVGLGAVGGGAFLVAKRRRRARDEQAVVDAREALRPHLQMLGDDVMQLEPEVVLHPDARDEYEAGVTRYRAALAAMDQVRTQADVDRLERVLVEGNYQMARARAVIEGRDAPPPPAELTHPGRHNEPPVVIDDDGRPAYAGYGGNYYGGGGWFDGGGLLTGILLGQVLTGWGGMFGGHRDGGWGGGGWGGGGGGDFGGGDFGGGDFGGGGDVGGGDF